MTFKTLFHTVLSFLLKYEGQWRATFSIESFYYFSTPLTDIFCLHPLLLLTPCHGELRPEIICLKSSPRQIFNPENFLKRNNSGRLI